MSRSYKNIIKVGICNGRNTEFYRYLNRKERNTNRHNLRNLMANYNIEDVNDLIDIIEFPHDDWCEPTDGTFLISKKSKDGFLQNHEHQHDGTSENWWNRKFGKYLKSKH